MTTIWRLVALAAAFAPVSSSAGMESDLEVLPSKEEQLIQLLSEDLAEMTPQEIAKFLLVDFNSVSVSEVTDKGLSGQCTLSKQDLSAECCATLSFKIFWTRHTLTGCASVKVLTKAFGLHIKITALGHTIYDKEISAREPPAICVGVPKIKLAKVCLDLRNVQWSNGFHACVAFEVHLLFKTLLDVQLGCIDV
ncbi:uncharacterized protein LOC110983142 [Acanthaster planci]|uniref:Uncharacterized protein LOC110983142 n=1 Tax=Acanthaster planci TaxID=133434 RepID=A0A8B7YWY0_ACAPL|nr:uncharacterized protein LOC110983142 [Acanthaster planci]